MFWFGPDISRWGVGAFLPANDSVQVRLGVDKPWQLDSVQLGENCGCECSGKEKEI